MNHYIIPVCYHNSDDNFSDPLAIALFAESPEEALSKALKAIRVSEPDTSVWVAEGPTAPAAGQKFALKPIPCSIPEGFNEPDEEGYVLGYPISTCKPITFYP